MLEAFAENQLCQIAYDILQRVLNTCIVFLRAPLRRTDGLLKRSNYHSFED